MEGEEDMSEGIKDTMAEITISVLRDKLASMTAELAEAQAKSAIDQRQCDGATAEACKMAAELAEKDKQLAAVTAERDHLQARIASDKEALDRKDAMLDSVTAERDRLRKALEELERHHIKQNRLKGRPTERSHTLAVIREALAGKDEGKAVKG
jgi:chromosome segregation ATPase